MTAPVWSPALYLRHGQEMVEFLPHQAVQRRIGERLGLLHGIVAQESAALATPDPDLPPDGTAPRPRGRRKPKASAPAPKPALALIPARVIKTVRALRALDYSAAEIVGATGLAADVVARALEGAA